MWTRSFKIGLALLLLSIFIKYCPLARAEAQEANVKRLTLSELRAKVAEARGKVVLIDFWSSTSPVSRQAMPFLNSLHEGYKDSGLVVMGITVEGVGEEVIKPFVKVLGIKYPIFIGGNDLVEAYDIQYLPVTYLLDREGKVGLKEIGFTKDTPKRLKQKVEELLKAGQ
jgi:thiol-disulfide isomerase/thioredoxin